jgi:hypothetical protein
MFLFMQNLIWTAICLSFIYFSYKNSHMKKGNTICVHFTDI